MIATENAHHIVIVSCLRLGVLERQLTRTRTVASFYSSLCYWPACMRDSSLSHVWAINWGGLVKSIFLMRTFIKNPISNAIGFWKFAYINVSDWAVKSLVFYSTSIRCEMFPISFSTRATCIVLTLYHILLSLLGRNTSISLFLASCSIKLAFEVSLHFTGHSSYHIQSIRWITAIRSSI